jgi:chromosome segregation ATPase
MDFLHQNLVPILTFIAGGGLMTLLSIRLKNRQLHSQVAGEEFKTMDEAIQTFTNRLVGLSEQLDKALEQNRLMKSQIEAMRQEHEQTVRTLHDDILSLKQMLEAHESNVVLPEPVSDPIAPAPRKPRSKKPPIGN